MGHERNMKAILLQIFGSQNKRFNRLINRPRSNRLHLRVPVFAKHARNCSCYRRSARISCNFDNVHSEAPC